MSNINYTVLVVGVEGSSYFDSNNKSSTKGTPMFYHTANNYMKGMNKLTLQTKFCPWLQQDKPIPQLQQRVESRAVLIKLKNKSKGRQNDLCHNVTYSPEQQKQMTKDASQLNPGCHLSLQGNTEFLLEV